MKSEPGPQREGYAPSQRWAPYGDSPYLLGPMIASGGMGTVHLGLQCGALGFRRLLAIKRLHGHLAQSLEFVARFTDEIRLVSQINHPNVVQTLDVVAQGRELALIMEFVEGITLQELLKDTCATGAPMPIPVCVGIAIQTLHGLHTAHDWEDEFGEPLGLVHRDVSPQNLMVGKDGRVKILDFGVAKASSEIHVTRVGQLSGKAPYMSPEQVLGRQVDRRADVFAMGIVLWEMITCSRLFRPRGSTEEILRNVLEMKIPAPSKLRPDLPAGLDRVVLRALERNPAERFASAREFATALEAVVPNASTYAVAAGVAEISGALLKSRRDDSARLRGEVSDHCLEITSVFARKPLTAEEETRLEAVIARQRLGAGAGVENLPQLPARSGDVTREPSGASMMRPRGHVLLRSAVLLALVGVCLGAWMTWSIRIEQNTVKTDVHAEPIPGTPPEQAAVALPLQERPSTLGKDVSRHAPPSPAGVLSVNGLPPAEELPETANVASKQSKTTRSRSGSMKPKTGTPSNGYPKRAHSSTSDAVQKQAALAPKVKLSPTLAKPAPIKQELTTQELSKREPTKPEPTQPNCSPPTYTDAEGIKHFKRACL